MSNYQTDLLVDAIPKAGIPSPKLLRDIATTALAELLKASKQSHSKGKDQLTDSESDLSYSSVWVDDESVLRDGAVTRADGLLSVTDYLDCVDGEGEKALNSASAWIKPSYGRLMTETANQYKRDIRLSKDEFHFGGFPYVTTGNLADPSGREPEMATAVAYAIFVSEGVKNHQVRWGGKSNPKEWQQIQSAAARRLLNTRYQTSKHRDDVHDDKGLAFGWGWRSRSRTEIATTKLYNKLNVPDMMSTWMACQALILYRSAMRQSDSGDDFSESITENEINAALSDVSIGLIRALKHNAARENGGETWYEFGTHGRSGLLYTVLGLKTLFMISNESHMEQDTYILVQSVRRFLRDALGVNLSNPDYHRLRDEDLVGMVTWEDYSLPYWLLNLIVDLRKWVKQNLERKTGALPPSLNKEINGSLGKAVLNSSCIQTLHVLRDSQRFLWPAGSYRVYATGEAVKAIWRLSSLAGISEGTSSTDALFIAIQQTLSGSLFSADFAEQTTAYLEKHFNQEISALDGSKLRTTDTSEDDRDQSDDPAFAEGF